MDANESADENVVNARRRTPHTDPPPEEFANPAGLGGEACEPRGPDIAREPCDPDSAEDLVLEESKPGVGIFGYEGEEVGGG
ncbi:MAG: hypothetical protein EG823_04175 [Actinobacteria bacterium]|nr:hypothetical protein [Actinomycetota bacterium]